MTQKYPLEWLDSLISLTLNPKKIYLHDLSKDEIQSLLDKAAIETVQIQAELKNQVFSLHKESQIRLLVQKYHSALIILLDTIIEYQNDKVFQSSEYSNLAKTLVACIDELLFFIEKRFSNFLGLEERVPATYLSLSKKELRLKLDCLKKKWVADIADPIFTNLIFEHVQRYTQPKANEVTTFRSHLYHRELVNRLENAGYTTSQSSVYSALDELLVYMNFNSRSYIRYFTTTIGNKINSLPDKSERIDSLRFHLKEFRQLQTHKNLILHPDRSGLPEVLTNWFEQEIRYLEKLLHIDTDVVKSFKGASGGAKVINKVKVHMSADQIALVLRACDESRLLEARSMREVFRRIIPHISTDTKVELSYESVRSKSYSAEERDKLTVIAVLDKIINKIRTY